MPYFAFLGVDDPAKSPERAHLRPLHRDHLRRELPDCRCLAGGPLQDEDQTGMVGTLLIFEATDKAAVEHFLADDPYALAGLFAHTDIWPWDWSLGRPSA